MIHCDSFLTIGSQHKICEDYILSGNEPFPYIVLSDGCSSSLNTDTGARILCQIAKRFLMKEWNYLDRINHHDMGMWILHNAEAVVKFLGMNLTCLDATLIVAYEVNDMIKVHMYGDGVVISQHPDGQLQLESISFEGNAPFYLSYRMHSDRLEVYESESHNQLYTTIKENGGGITTSGYYSNEIELSFTPSEENLIFVCSDGIESFTQRHNLLSKVEVLELAKRFAAFKNTKGEFLKRRMNKELKLLDREGYTHFDDLSIGAFLYLGD